MFSSTIQKRKKMGDDGTYRYTGVSCDAATIISGGRIVTSLIDVTSLFAQNITLNPNGYIQSSNYRESGGSPASGFKIDAKSGTIKSYGMVANSMTAVGGTFDNISANNAKFNNCVLNGYLYTNKVPFILVAMINFRIQDMYGEQGYFTNYKTANVKSFKRRETGTYEVFFQNPVTTKIFKAMGSDGIIHNYLTLLFLGNAHSSRDSFAHNCICTTNFDLISIDNMRRNIIEIDENSMIAKVYGAVLYTGDNNNDDLVDFITIQGFFVGTEPNL